MATKAFWHFRPQDQQSSYIWQKNRGANGSQQEWSEFWILNHTANVCVDSKESNASNIKPSQGPSLATRDLEIELYWTLRFGVDLGLIMTNLLGGWTICVQWSNQDWAWWRLWLTWHVETFWNHQEARTEKWDTSSSSRGRCLNTLKHDESPKLGNHLRNLSLRCLRCFDYYRCCVTGVT